MCHEQFLTLKCKMYILFKLSFTVLLGLNVFLLTAHVKQRGMHYGGINGEEPILHTLWNFNYAFAKALKCVGPFNKANILNN